MKLFLLGAAFAVALMVMFGCGDKSDKWPAEGVPLLRGNNTRVEVTMISWFSDDLAYDGKRGVYIIKDTYTNTEYIGISGVGISAVSAHGDDKHTDQDER